MAAADPSLSSAPMPLPDSLARLDALHLRRDEPAALEEAHQLAAAALKAAPSDYGTLWRAARVRFTESDQRARSAPSARAWERKRTTCPASHRGQPG